jgi:hypothetical protein
VVRKEKYHERRILDLLGLLLVDAEYETLFVPVHLGPAFAKGWSKLPAELKLLIIERNVSTLGKFRPINRYASVFETSRCFDRSNLEVLYHHLRMTPEIAALAKQVFYNSNGFNLGVTSFRGDMALFPDVLPGHLVQRIEISVVLGIEKPWSLLDAVYKQSAALPTLQYVQVTIFLGEEYLHAVSTRGNLINYWLEEHSAQVCQVQMRRRACLRKADQPCRLSQDTGRYSAQGRDDFELQNYFQGKGRPFKRAVITRESARGTGQDTVQFAGNGEASIALNEFKKHRSRWWD